MKKLLTILAWVVASVIGIAALYAFYLTIIISKGWLLAWLAFVGLGVWAFGYLSKNIK